MNVTVAGSSAAGYLALGASDKPLPGTSTINYAAGAVRANNAVVELSGDGTGSFVAYNYSTASVQLILDVNGYFQ